MFRREVSSSSSAQNDDMHHRRVISSSSPPISDDYMPKTVEDIFVNYRLRRVGLLRAFGTDVATLYFLCNPDKNNLCLYGYPDGTWDVREPGVLLPPNLPEPAVGINFARDGMRAIVWLTLVAVHSDSWLRSLASFFGAGLSRDDSRESLFERINDIPTLAEKVKEYYPGQMRIDTRITPLQEMENLCSYGHPNGTWEVNLPAEAEEVPPELPEPALESTSQEIVCSVMIGSL
ncbi:hypothetical protein Bca52824_005756 [Brassica carinata]|uniref:PHD finger protein ALFIN-LIKE n=1 Tax=Brassica carinata TaxID=52824 RepID=A0A8X7WQR7_BRACI|nr:hypothetical protein Bca52824_005756 [Brassica carinata]